MRAKIPWDLERKDGYALREWEIDPSRSVLLIVDMQSGYVDPEAGIGKILQRDYPEIYSYYYNRLGQVVLPNILKLRDFFRGHGLEVFYTRYGFQLPEGGDLPEGSWRKPLLQRHQEKESCLFYKESPEYELAKELRPLASELVLDKNTLSPLNSTPLDQILRNMELENIVVTGILTEAAVDLTARSAGDRGYNVMIAGDACATYDEADHENQLHAPNNYVVKTTEEIINIFTPLLEAHNPFCA